MPYCNISIRVVATSSFVGSFVDFSNWLLFAFGVWCVSNPNKTGADRYSLIPTFRDAADPDTSVVWQSGAPFSPEQGAFAPRTTTAATRNARM